MKTSEEFQRELAEMGVEILDAETQKPISKDGGMVNVHIHEESDRVVLGIGTPERISLSMTASQARKLALDLRQSANRIERGSRDQA